MFIFLYWKPNWGERDLRILSDENQLNNEGFRGLLEGLLEHEVVVTIFINI